MYISVTLLFQLVQTAHIHNCWLNLGKMAAIKKIIIDICNFYGVVFEMDIYEHASVDWSWHHYLFQCWPRSMTPYGVTRPGWTGSSLAQAMACCRLGTMLLPEPKHIYCYVKDIVCKMSAILFRPQCVNSSPLGQNDRHFADDVFSCIFVNEKFCILIKISLKFVAKGPIDNNPALV